MVGKVGTTRMGHEGSDPNVARVGNTGSQPFPGGGTALQALRSCTQGWAGKSYGEGAIHARWAGQGGHVCCQ